MAKFLKNFQNHTQYETYTASTVFITPNVSYCKQEDEVHYSSSSEPPTPPVVHVDSVSVSPATVTLNVGATTALTATVLPSDATDKSVTWSSSNPAIATVDTNGVVSGIASGDVVITVTTVDGGKTAQCNVTVNESSHDYVDLGLPSGKKWATMNIGATSETDYGKYYQYGKGADDYFVTSGQSDYSGTEIPLAASADTATQVLGAEWHTPTEEQFRELTANTTYTWETNFKGSGVNGGKFTASNGKYIFFPANGHYSYGSINDLNNSSHYWSSTRCTVPGAPGALHLSCYAERYYVINWEYNHGFAVRPVKDGSPIPDVPVTGVTLDKETLLVDVNDSYTLTATVQPNNADIKDVIWASTNNNVVTVDSNGVLSPVYPGEAVISVTTLDGGYTAQCRVNITSEDCFINYEATERLNVSPYAFYPMAAEETFADNKGVIRFVTPLQYTENSAFNGKTALTSIKLPNSLRSLAAYEFAGCTNLESITLSNSILALSNYMFQNCQSLTGITIPSSVTFIGINAFYGCSSLTGVTIPSSVTVIEQSAFVNCTNLQNITVEATTPATLNWNPFDNTNNCPIYVPCESVEAYKTAPGWSAYASRIQCVQPTPIIYEITVTPSAGKVMKGEEVIFTANVNSSIPSASAVTWNFEDCHLVGTTGNSIAVVYNEDSTTDIMWVTATSVYDESVCDYNTVSIYKAIEHLSIYVYEETHNLNEGTVVNCEMYVAPSEDMWAEECCVNSVEWFSSDSSIATVDDNGQVTIQKRPEGVDSVDITCKISDCYGEYVSDPITFTWDDESADPFEP